MNDTTPTPPRDDIVTWTSGRHLERACQLAQQVENRELGTADGINNAIGLARLHLLIGAFKSRTES